MIILAYTLGVFGLTIGLIVVSYLDRVYREMGRVSTGRIRDHVVTFESEIEPRFKLDRPRAALAFSLLARLWLVFLAAVTALAVNAAVPGRAEFGIEIVIFLTAEVMIAMQFLPFLLLASARGDWIASLVPIVRLLLWLTWPFYSVLNLLSSILRLSEEEPSAPAGDQQAIEAFVDAATEEGIIEQDEARLIEQVVEFGEKRVRDVMTPRPDVVAIPANASIEELGERIVETKFSRLPVYGKSLDDVLGIVVAKDMLEIPDRDASRRTVRELVHPALFVPETKFGSELLKEMQRKNQHMAIVIDEYGLLAGVVTVEDLVEEIVGEMAEEDHRPVPDVARESGGAMVLRGSVPVDKLAELFGIELDTLAGDSNATTLAGLLNSVAGHVPRTGETLELAGLRFEVLEANQRKVLRVRARRPPVDAATSARTV
ncbi:MAG TPA: hemolysin family protein [Candidatus Acidoferrales bacterium]|jgi:CBS domain containing-hemolysin-like protein|nr:hemolysin family protein [Candidatus Acidoferrales bacterium]